MSSKDNAMEQMLRQVLEQIPDPSRGLPDPVFNFALKITPMINVDLLVRNDHGEHLLAWRKDAWAEGWHIPGGIIRYNETIHARVAAVARAELAASVRYSPFPVDIKQFFHRRGHFISLLFLCELTDPVPSEHMLQPGAAPRNGKLKWIKGMPTDLYRVHDVYAEWLHGRAQ